MAISPMTRAGPPGASAILFSFELHVYCCTFCGSLLKPSKTCLFLIGATQLLRDLLARCCDVHLMPGLHATTSEHHSKLSLMFLNSRSLVNKLVDFQASIYANSVDIVIVTETWLSPPFWIMKFYQFATMFIVETEDKTKEVEEFL